MVDLPKKKLPAAIKDGNRYGISLGSIDTFLRSRAFDGSTVEPGADILRLNLGVIEGSQHDRDQLGPVFVDFVLSRTLEAAPFPEAPAMVDRARLVTDRLKELLEERKERQASGKLAEYNASRREYLQVAHEQRGTDIFTDAAIVTSETLRAHGAYEVAADVVASLGSLAQRGMQEEIEAAADVIRTRGAGSDIDT